MAWSEGEEEEGVTHWPRSAVERGAYQTATQTHHNYRQNNQVQVVHAKTLPWRLPQSSSAGMIMWERLWTPHCLGSETLQEPQSEWGAPQKGTGG